MSSKREARLEKKTREIAHQLYQDRLIFGRDGNATEDWTKASWIAQDPFREFLFSFRFLFRSNESIEAFIYENFGDFSIGTFIANSSKELEGKTLWSWAELLLVPGLLAWGAFYLENRVEERQDKRDQERAERAEAIADDRVKQEIFSNYLSEMRGLLIDSKLREAGSDTKSEVWTVAQALTSTTIKELGNERNAFLLNFLRQSNLIGEPQEGERGPSLLKDLDLTDVNLRDAILSSTDLSRADLSRANLFGANLSRANLSDANLRDANLISTFLPDSDLSRAFLRDANLSVANLGGANLSGANLEGANLISTFLISADLSDADLSGANIEEAFLCETILPSGIDNLDPNRDCEALGISPD